MLTYLKWLFPGLLLIILVVWIAFGSSMQNITTNTTSEVEALAESVSVGLIRSNLDENGQSIKEIEYLNAEQLIANLTSNIESVQKNYNYDIQLTYVFLDKNSNVTGNENSIQGIQFRIQLVDPDTGDVKGTAEKRLQLNQIKS